MKNVANKIQTMNIFFAVDDNYAKLLAVTLRSLLDNASSKDIYNFYVLETNLSSTYKKQLTSMVTGNNKISFVNVTKKLEKLSYKLTTRDYYTISTYYRIFIPELFPNMDKCLYLDCDIVILDNIAKLYKTFLGNNLVGAARDEVLSLNDAFKEYADLTVGVGHMKYFNAGILLMNLKEMRKTNFFDKFLELLEERKFPVAQDQDYLNVLCNKKVTYIPLSWNKTPIKQPYFREKSAKLVHFKMAWKPWHYFDVLYEDLFWEYAMKTPYYYDLLNIRNSYTPEMVQRDEEAATSLYNLVVKENDDYKEFLKESDDEEFGYLDPKAYVI